MIFFNQKCVLMIFLEKKTESHLVYYNIIYTYSESRQSQRLKQEKENVLDFYCDTLKFVEIHF